jgi:hypothetical protein
MSTEYGKIDTLYERDKATFKVQPGIFKNRTYSLLKTWRWTEKVDGTNVRVSYFPGCVNATAEDVMVNGAGPTVTVGGRTDNAQMPADLVQSILAQVTIEKMASVFQSSVVLYGEGYGGSIQKGSGYSPTKKFILFDVLIDGTWWMNQEQIQDIAGKLGLDVVPVVGDWSMEEATDFVRGGFHTLLPGAAPDKMAEGLVGRPLETMYDSRHHRLITKLKTKDF